MIQPEFNSFSPIKEQQLCLPLPKKYKLVQASTSITRPISLDPCSLCAVYEECHRACDPHNTEPINQKLLSLIIDCIINDDALCYIADVKS